MQAHNMHATGLVVGEHGVLVAGPSGSGKTALALGLLAHCRQWGVFAALVADDQVLVAPANGRLVMRAPAPIAGMAEVRGLGPVPLAHQPQAVVDLAVRLVEPDDAPRMADDKAFETVLGVALPRLDLAASRPAAGVSAVAARLSLPPFAASRGATGRRYGRPTG